MCRITHLNLLPRIFQGFFSFFLISSSMAFRAPCKVTADSLWVLAPWRYTSTFWTLILLQQPSFSSGNRTPWCTAPPLSHGLPEGWSLGLRSSLRISQNRLGGTSHNCPASLQSPGGRGPQPLLQLKCSAHIWYTVNTPTLMLESH